MIGEIIKCKNRIKKKNKIMERVPVTVKLWKANINAIIPQYAKNGDAGMDLTAVSVTYDEKLDCFVYDTGICVAIPEGYVGLVYPRSSNRKTDVYMTNHVGVIDSGYRGNILVCFKNRTSQHIINACNNLAYDVDSIADTINASTDCYFEGTTCPTIENNEHDYPYNIGDRIAQIMIVPYPKVIFEEVDSKDDLGETERGDDGHGSTGK